MGMRLAIVPKAGAAIIAEFGLFVEANPERDSKESDDEFRDRVISAHAPFDLPGERYQNTKFLRAHIASGDPALRAASLQYIGEFIDKAHARYPNLELVNMHAAPKRFPHPPLSPQKVPPDAVLEAGTPEAWARLVDGVRTLAKHSAKLGLTLAVENNWAYWWGVAETTPAEQVNFERLSEYWCTSPDEWARLQKDVNEPNLVACLDPSHATPFTHRKKTLEERRAQLAKFLPSGPVGRKFGHLHWNDSDIESIAGRGDLHLCIGEGSLGAAFHGELKRWALANNRVPLLEHFYSRERLVRELDYIEKL